MNAKPALMLAAMLTLAACATPPQVVRTGDLSFMRGKTVALAPTEATPLERTGSDQAAAVVLKKLGARPGDPSSADYLLQVAISKLPRNVGVMRDAGGAWISNPGAHRRFWRRGPTYGVSITAIEAGTGKAAYSVTATESARGDPAAAIDRLVTAALAD